MADTPSPLSLGPLAPAAFEGRWLGEEGGKLYDEALAASKKAAEKQKEIAEGFEKRRPKEEAETERAIGGVEKAVAQPRPSIPSQERVPSPPKPEDYHKMSMGYLGAMVLLGAFGGKFIRNAANAPLAAFNGALNGWQEGNMEAYKEKTEEWKQKQQQVLDNNRARLDEYRTILEDRNASIQDQMLRVKLTAAKHQDKMMYDRADAENWTGVAQAFDQGVAVHERAVAATDKIIEQLTAQNATSVERANQLQQQLPTPEGQQWLHSLTPGQRVQVEGFVRTYADQAPAAPAQLPAPGPAGGSMPTEPPPGTPMPDAASAVPRVAMRPELRSPTMPKDFKTAATNQLYRETYAAYQRGERASPDPSLDEIADAERKLHQPRSQTGLLTQKYLEEHPDATYEEAAEAAAEQAGRMAGQRTGGTMAMRVEAATNEVAIALPQALEASRALPRGPLVPLNELIQKWERGVSDPRYNDFMVANVTLLNAYVRAMNPQGIPRIAERMEAHAIGLLSMATSQQAYEVQLRRLWREVQGSRKAVAQTRRGEEGPTEFPGGAAKAPGGGSFTPDELNAEMQRRGLR